MPRQSAGILLYRRRAGELEVLLVHPGGPFWLNKNDGAWSIPKGEFDSSEDPLKAAQREFREETGAAVEGQFHPLSPVKQRSGKTVHAWAVEGDFDPARLRSNTFMAEWPPRSGQQRTFPEVDRADWFPLDTARQKIHPQQTPLLTELVALLP
jgi:predicted NUDIX family NTP pyrophosphohydrolase